VSPELIWTAGLAIGVLLGIPLGFVLAQDGTLRVILAAILPADDRRE
jgi:hypothetical protein